LLWKCNDTCFLSDLESCDQGFLRSILLEKWSVFGENVQQDLPIAPSILGVPPCDLPCWCHASERPSFCVLPLPLPPEGAHTPHIHVPCSRPPAPVLCAPKAEEDAWSFPPHFPNLSPVVDLGLGVLVTCPHCMSLAPSGLPLTVSWFLSKVWINGSSTFMWSGHRTFFWLLIPLFVLNRGQGEIGEGRNGACAVSMEIALLSKEGLFLIIESLRQRKTINVFMLCCPGRITYAFFFS
jgi:hypothetical protein